MNNQHRIALASMRLLAATLKAGLVLAILGGTSAFAGVSIAIDPFAIAQTIRQATQSTPGPVYRSKPAATSPAQKKRSKSLASNEAARAESASPTQTRRGEITDGNSLQSNLRLYRRYTDGAKLRTDEILTCFVTVGYIQGLEGGSEPWATLYKAECPYAVPRMPVSQLIQVVDKYLTDHPEELHQPAAALFFAAITQSFPNPEFEGRDNTTTTAPVEPATARSAQTADPDGMVREVTPPPGLIGTDWSENDSSANAGKRAGGKAAGQRKTTAESNDQQSLTYWLTSSSNKRHNSSCRWYRASHGRPCGADEGIPCKICGG
jgi:Ssp1 endopeptidase immunity protein Rap1a